MFVSGAVVALLCVAVGLGGSALQISWPLLLIILVILLAAYLGSRRVVTYLCYLSLPKAVWRRILSMPGLNRFDPVQATLKFVPRQQRPPRHVSVCLKNECEILIDLIVRDFVMSWYEWLSNDQLVPDEVASALHDVFDRAHALFQHVDQHRLFREILLLARVHFSAYRLALDNVDRKVTAVDYNDALAKQYHREFCKLVPHQPEQDGEDEFLRHITDLLLGLLLPMSDLRCEPARQLLGDILSVSMMKTVVDLIVDPDWINEIIIIALDETPAETLAMIDAFDESPVGTRQVDATADTSDKASTSKDKPDTNHVSVSPPVVAVMPAATEGAGKTVDMSEHPESVQHPVALPATRSRYSPLSRSGSSDQADSDCTVGSVEVAQSVGYAVVSKLSEQIIGIVGHQTVRRSSLETEYVVYSIQFKPALLWPDTKCSFDTVHEVTRRYKQFDAFFSRIKDNVRLSKSLVGIDLPGKRILPHLTKNQMEEFARMRRDQLDLFLKTLAASCVLRQCEEFKSFLVDAPGHEAFPSRSRAGIIRPLTRVLDVVTDRFRHRSSSGIAIGAHPHWHREEISGRVPHSVNVFRAFTRSYSVSHSDVNKTEIDVTDSKDVPADWELRCLEWQLRTEQAVESTWRGQNSIQCEDAIRNSTRQPIPRSGSVTSLPASLNPRDANFAMLDRRWPVATALFEFGTTIVARPSALKSELFQKFVICGLGEIVDKFVCSELDELLRERRLAYTVRLLRETLWPNGHWPEETSPVVRSKEECQANKAEALRRLIDFLPGFLRVIVGPKTYDGGLAQVLDSLQNAAINRCMFHGFLNVIVEHLATAKPLQLSSSSLSTLHEESE